MSPKYRLAAEGKRQSPINIPSESTVPAQLPVLRFQYQKERISAVNNGHTIQHKEKRGSFLHVGDRVYALEQFHFHVPSEHTIDGKHSALEMHLVHQKSDGALGVIGVMINSGQTNQQFAPIWHELPLEAGEERHLDENTVIEADNLLPHKRNYYRYDGSLTTPPCSEGVTWFVLQSPIEMSESQISAFEVIFENNNRPVQSLNGREVLMDVAVN